MAITFICPDCQCIRLHHARGLCQACYDKKYARERQRLDMRELYRFRSFQVLRIREFARQLDQPEE